MRLGGPGPYLEEQGRGGVQKYVESGISFFNIFNALAPTLWYMKSPKTPVPRLLLLHQRIDVEYGDSGSNESSAAKGKSKYKPGTVGEESFAAMGGGGNCGNHSHIKEMGCISAEIYACIHLLSFSKILQNNTNDFTQKVSIYFKLGN